MNNFYNNFLINKHEVSFIFNIFEKENLEIRLVGGCVRDLLLERKSKDIDCVVNTSPDFIIEVLKKNNIKFNDFAKRYGSINFFIKNQKFSITSLRKDINQMGRHTEIEYTTDWETDACRRDFTINAIYLTKEGKLIDYFDGYSDLKSNKIKFIGNIEKRICEDFLRIFRYYRFLGIFDELQVIKDYEQILHRNLLKAFKKLTNEMIRVEILKMLQNPFPINSFCNHSNLKQKNLWLKITTNHFINQKYMLGLEKCLNKVNQLF